LSRMLLTAWDETVRKFWGRGSRREMEAFDWA